MYGGKKGDAGFFGYSHFAGGFPGGQAEYVKVPKGDVNCQKIPDEVVGASRTDKSPVRC